MTLRHRARGALLVVLVGAACSGDATSRRVVIPSGASFRVAADSLAAKGIIRFPRVFAWYASLTGKDRAIKAGTYQLTSSQSWGEVLGDLGAGRSMVHTITIPEGWNLGKILPQLARVLEVPVEELEHTVEAALPIPEQQRLLDIGADEPCLILHRRSWSGGKVVTVATFTYPASRYSLYSRHKISARGAIGQ